MSYYKLKVDLLSRDGDFVKTIRVYGGSIREIRDEFVSIFPWITTRLYDEEPVVITENASIYTIKSALSKIGNPPVFLPQHYHVQIYKRCKSDKKLKLSFHVRFPFVELLEIDTTGSETLFGNMVYRYTYIYTNIMVDKSFMRVF